MRDSRVRPSQLPEALIAEGRYWASTAGLAELAGQQPAILYSALARLEHSGRLFSPARGLYVAVPAEYRSWGVVPADWFIDAMMRHLGRAYYVAFLTAAAYHGAAHQAPQTFQVMISRPLANRDLGRVRLRFTTSRAIDAMETQRTISHTGYFTLATRETTSVDLAWRPQHGAGLSNVATVLKEIGELDGELLARLAEIRGRATARRLGWLLERLRPDVDLHWLRVIARPEAGVATALSTSSPLGGPINRSWNIRVNATVEPDV